MGIAGPETRWQKFRKTTAPFDAAAAILGGGGFAATAAAAFARGDQVWGGVGIILAFAAVGLQLAKARATYLEQVRKDSTHELQGCLHTLETILLGPDMANRAAAGLRLTIHRPDGRGSLEQVMEYVGNRRATDKTVGRKLPETVGVIGQAYREAQLDPGKLEVFHDFRTGPDHDAFVAQMVRDYSFSRKAAERLHPATMSWVAIAIPNEGGVEGVLYCDSKQADFFTDARKEDILHATAGIAYFIGLRYP